MTTQRGGEIDYKVEFAGGKTGLSTEAKALGKDKYWKQGSMLVVGKFETNIA